MPDVSLSCDAERLLVARKLHESLYANGCDEQCFVCTMFRTLDARDTALREASAEIERLREGLETIAGAIEGCLDAPRNPDSLPQMILYEARRVLGLADRAPEAKP